MATRMTKCNSHMSRLQAMAWIGTITAVALGTEVQAQAEDLPIVDPAVPRLEAQTPKENAAFGFSMAAGRLRGALDEFDDAVICAINEADNGISGVGAAYVFEDELLEFPSDKPLRLLPTGLAIYGGAVNSGALLGDRSLTIGNPRGLQPNETPFANLILIGCAFHDAEYPGIGSNAQGGSVEMYDYNSGGLSPPQKSLFAPLNADDEVPHEVFQFGHGLDLGDVTRDGVPDLIVGALGTTFEATGSGRGRFYVFEGHPDISGVGDFFDAPHYRWIGMNAVEPHDPDEDWGGQFGATVAACNFTDDSAVDVLVGRQDRGFEATITVEQGATVQNEPKGGSAYIFRGKYLHDLFGGYPYHRVTNPTGTLNVVNTPPWPDEDESSGGLDPDEPEYQVLRNPFGDSTQPDGSGRTPLWADAFGWFVYNGGDLGSPQDGPYSGGLDGIDDAVAFAEQTDYIGNGSLAEPEVESAGGLWVYFGTGETGPTMVHDDEYEPYDHKEVVLLQRPSNVSSTPETEGRFGRAFARLDHWRASPTAEPQPAILIGELNATWDSVQAAGLVYLVRLPLPGPSANPLTPVDIQNAWGSEPLTEPAPPDAAEEGAQHLFGSWIVVLDYKDEQDNEGQQFIVSSREAAIKPTGGDIQLKAGRAFPFLQPMPDP